MDARTQVGPYIRRLKVLKPGSDSISEEAQAALQKYIDNVNKRFHSNWRVVKAHTTPVKDFGGPHFCNPLNVGGGRARALLFSTREPDIWHAYTRWVWYDNNDKRWRKVTRRNG